MGPEAKPTASRTAPNVSRTPLEEPTEARLPAPSPSAIANPLPAPPSTPESAQRAVESLVGSLKKILDAQNGALQEIEKSDGDGVEIAKRLLLDRKGVVSKMREVVFAALRELGYKEPEKEFTSSYGPKALDHAKQHLFDRLSEHGYIPNLRETEVRLKKDINDPESVSAGYIVGADVYQVTKPGREMRMNSFDTGRFPFGDLGSLRVYESSKALLGEIETGILGRSVPVPGKDSVNVLFPANITATSGVLQVSSDDYYQAVLYNEAGHELINRAAKRFLGQSFDAAQRTEDFGTTTEVFSDYLSAVAARDVKILVTLGDDGVEGFHTRGIVQRGIERAGRNFLLAGGSRDATIGDPQLADHLRTEILTEFEAFLKDPVEKYTGVKIR